METRLCGLEDPARVRAPNVWGEGERLSSLKVRQTLPILFYTPKPTRGFKRPGKGFFFFFTEKRFP